MKVRLHLVVGCGAAWRGHLRAASGELGPLSKPVREVALRHRGLAQRAVGLTATEGRMIWVQSGVGIRHRRRPGLAPLHRLAKHRLKHVDAIGSLIKGERRFF